MEVPEQWFGNPQVKIISHFSTRFPTIGDCLMAETQRVCLSIVSLPKQINTTLTLLPTRFTGKHLHGQNICHSSLWHNRVFAWLPPVSDNLREFTLQGWCEVLMYRIVGRQIKVLWHQQLRCCETSNWLAHDSPITGGWRAGSRNEGWGWWSSWLTHLKPQTWPELR